MCAAAKRSSGIAVARTVATCVLVQSAAKGVNRLRCMRDPDLSAMRRRILQTRLGDDGTLTVQAHADKNSRGPSRTP